MVNLEIKRWGKDMEAMTVENPFQNPGSKWKDRVQGNDPEKEGL